MNKVFGLAGFQGFRVVVRQLIVLSGLVLAMLLALPAHAEDDFLEPEKAFVFSARMADPSTVEVVYDIADGYYMYRERFSFRAQGAKLGKAQLPPGKVKFDETFNKEVETYRHRVSVRIPVEASAPFTLISTGQGCADQGLCYAPMESQMRLSPVAATSASPPSPVDAQLPQASPPAPQTTVAATPPAVSPQLAPANADSEMGSLEASLKSRRLVLIMPLFLLLGLGLAFTPCVLPMVPILSFIIVGEGAGVSRKRGLLLSAAYSLGMALVYTALGVTAGLLGEGLSASLQKPWVLGGLSLMMVVFSLGMFGVYQIQMPSFIQTRLTAASEKQRAGKLLGVFTMGAISALIVGPCVAAPLAATLVYISQTRDVLVGGGALFAMAAGMSVPLLLVGVSAGSLLPKAGAWMENVKRFFGVLMLGLALWMASPLLPVPVQMIGWAALGLGYGAYLLWSRPAGVAAKLFAALFLLLGAAEGVGAFTGGDVLTPWSGFGSKAAHKEFVRVKTSAELDAALANAGGKPVMLDFYADWCVSCKEMERFTFSDPRVQARFGKMLLLQIDVTANNADDKAMLKRFGLFGPPGIIFFDPQGQEIAGTRVVGYQKTEKFLESLRTAGISE